MSSTAPLFTALVGDANQQLDPHDRLRTLYRALLDDQDHFDEFQHLLSQYVMARDATEEPPGAMLVRALLNARIREWIGPFEGLSVAQTQLWRDIIVEQRINIAIAPWKESNIY